MQRSDNFPSREWEHWICPPLGTYWKLGKRANSDRFVLQSSPNHSPNESLPARIFIFDAAEGYALQHFNGCHTVKQIQTRVRKRFPNADPYLVVKLIVRLIEERILAVGDGETGTRGDLGEGGDGETGKMGRRGDGETGSRGAMLAPGTEEIQSKIFKPTVEWHYNPDGYWILRNSEDRTFIQVSSEDKVIIEQLGLRSQSAIAAEFGISPHHLKHLLQLLAATGMLQGTQPAKRQRGKFNPLQLLFFKLPLFNPDPWLSRQMPYLHWMWTRTFAAVLVVFLVAAAVVGLNQRDAIVVMGQQLMQSQGASLFIPFALLSAFVVTLHELGHAFTLKQYGRQVPEIGLLFMCLFPAAYTDTTDQYCLSRWKRILVVAAGICVQVTIAAIALFFWNLSVPGSWVHTASYLLTIAALFTIAVNLNPLAKFDGYYLAVAVTGINNLRSRALGFYVNLLTGQPLKERAKDCLILAIYGPFSLLYIWSVFGFLFYRLTDWTLVNIPTIGLMLLLGWAIYYFFPASSKSTHPQ